MKKLFTCVAVVISGISQPSHSQAPTDARVWHAGQIFVGDGSNTAPSYALSSAPGVGFYKRRDGDGQGLLFAAGGRKGVIALTSGTLALESLHELVWSSQPHVDNLKIAANDVRLGRDGAGILRFIAAGGSTPVLRIYGAYKGSSSNNYERLAISAPGNGMILRTEAAGNGALRALHVGTGSNEKWVFDTRGNFGRGSASPLASSCGKGARVEGRDSGMTATVGDGIATTCTVGFGTAWSTAPSCVANSDKDFGPFLVSTTADSVSITAASALTKGSKLHIHCMGV